MSYRKTQNTMSLLGGAALGAAAMYLLDPQSGERRREHLKKATGQTLHEAAEAAEGAWEQVAEHAQAVGRHARDVAHDVASRAADYTQDAASGAATGAEAQAHSAIKTLKKTVADLQDHLTGRAQDARDAASSQASRFGQNLRGATSRAAASISDALPSWGREEEGFGTGTVAGAGIGFLALGAAAMYFADPQRGHARRTEAWNKMSSCLDAVGTTFRRTGRDLMNRGRGAAIETYKRIQPDQPSADLLLERVRARIGHAVARPALVQVMTDAAGNVTLTGSVLSTEVDSLLSLLRTVPGVSNIDNLMQPETSHANAAPQT